MATKDIEACRKIIEQILEEYAAIPYAIDTGVERKVVFDRNRDSYLLVITGWDHQGKRTHGCIIHVDIIEGKLWIQRDGTESGVAGDLERAGIDKQQIVLGFKDPETRKHTEYAMG